MQSLREYVTSRPWVKNRDVVFRGDGSLCLFGMDQGGHVTSLEHIVSECGRRYAHALFSLSQEQDVTQEVETSLTTFLHMLEKNEDLRHFVQNPIFSVSQQKKVLSTLLSKAEIKGLAAQFLYLLIVRRRLSLAQDIIYAFHAMLDAKRGVVDAQIWVAHSLTSEQQQRVEEALTQASGASSIRLKTHIDPSILGGMVVKLGSRMVDTSVRAKLRSIHTRMKGIH